MIIAIIFQNIFSISADIQCALLDLKETFKTVRDSELEHHQAKEKMNDVYFPRFEETCETMKSIYSKRKSGKSWEKIFQPYVDKVYREIEEKERKKAMRQFYMALTEFNDIEK